MDSFKLGRQQLRGLFRKQFTLQFRQKKSLVCLIIYPLLILALCFLFSILSPMILDTKAIEQERLNKFPKYNLFERMKKVWLNSTESRSSNFTRLVLPKFFIITCPIELKDKIGNLSKTTVSHGLLANIDQIGSNSFGKIPYSVHSFNNSNEVDEYIFNYIDLERQNFIISTDMTQLIGAYDINTYTSNSLVYTILHDSSCDSCFNHHYRTIPEDTETMTPVEATRVIQSALMTMMNDAYCFCFNI
jgi:hypothetical protein